MNYSPNPKELVYNELYFISTSVPRKPSAISIFAAMDEIVDSVSNEIHELFIGVPLEQQPEVASRNESYGAMEFMFGTQIIN